MPRPPASARCARCCASPINLPLTRISHGSLLRNTTRTATFVHGLFRFPWLELTDADPQAIRAPPLHPRAPEGVGRAALLRRDEGRARSALQVRHPPPDHGARGARLHPPPAQPGPRPRSDHACPRPCRPAWAPRRAAASRRTSSRARLGRVARTTTEDEGGRPVAVPVMGRIAAGTPIAAIQTRSHTDARAAGDAVVAGEHFALEVRGDFDDRGRHLRGRHSC